jgi:peptidoglycan hydrolase-like protein with peptidoglycan-binding domain
MALHVSGPLRPEPVARKSLTAEAPAISLRWPDTKFPPNRQSPEKPRNSTPVASCKRHGFAFTPPQRHKNISKRVDAGRGVMSRVLSSTEQRICRVVFAFLGAMFFAFLLLNTIGSLSTSSPPVNKIQPGTNDTSSHLKQAIQSSPPLQPVRSETRPAQKSAAVPLPAAKARSGPPEGMAIETAIRFDAQRLERRLDGPSLVPARGLSRLSSAEVPATIPSAESFELSRGGLIVTPMFATPEPSPESRAPSTQGGLSYEHVQQIQARLRDLGFLSSPANGAWDTNSRAALRDFKVVNRLANDDVWDLQTRKTLASETAVRADESFIGSWSQASCRSASKDNLRLTINSRRIRTSAGSVCEFHGFAADRGGGWRVRTSCLQGNQHWKADGKLAIRENKLIWTSGGDVSSYFRCN